MTLEEKPSSREISVTTDGVVLRGAVVDDVRPPLKRIAKTADSVLRLLDNVVGLPTDFLNVQLETFREKYKERLNRIPLENRQEPPLRVGCAVLRHVAYAAEEPEIQELFAQLLATASDTQTEAKAHPAFASVINDLQPEEAKLLLVLQRIGRPIPTGSFENNLVGAAFDGEYLPNFDRSLSNLLRLGLIELVANQLPPSAQALQNIARTPSYGNPRSIEDLDRVFTNALNDVQNLKASVVKAFKEQNIQRHLCLTAFGKQFLEACMPQDDQQSGADSGANPIAGD